MRLTCPNCGIEYDVPEGQVASGRQVECSACHTRWFAQAPRPASEEQVLARLEAWSPRPAPVPPEPDTGHNLWDTSDGQPEPAPEAAAPPPPAPRPEALAKPADRPTVAQPGPVAELPPARSAPRLDLGPNPAAAAVSRPPSRFAHGLALVLVLFALALGAYRYGDALAARLPAAAPALSAYGAWVDGLRERLEPHLAPLREAARR
jgi:predicted Zn finger-like uncharacterized protein